MYTPTERVVEAALAHAAESAPNESCGVIILAHGKDIYAPCRNISPQPANHFLIDPADYAAAEDRGEIIAIVHSHYGIPAEATQGDRVMCESTALPWLITSYPLNTWKMHYPDGYKAPLIGRPYVDGVLDCFTLVKDYYELELGIKINYYDHIGEWWHTGKTLYLDHFIEEGFVRVDGPLLKHDGLLMQMNSPTPNHAAVYLGDDNMILHHVTGRLSCRDVYGGFWRKATYMQLRHRSLL